TTRAAATPSVAPAAEMSVGQPGVASAKPGTDASSAAVVPAAGSRPDGLTLPELLMIAWAVGAAAVLLRLSLGTLRVWRIARRSTRMTDARWLALSQRIAQELKVSRPLTLLQGDSLNVPVTFGVVFPVVLLPADAHLWPMDRRRLVLLHEVAHVKRMDAFTQVLSQFVLATFWFNPLVWVALKHIRAERERACDDYVLRGGMKASVYVDDLIAMVRSIDTSSGPAFAALAMARRSEFEGRMLAILDSRLSRRTAGRVVAGFATLTMLLVAAPLAAMRAVPQTPDQMALAADHSPNAAEETPVAASAIDAKDTGTRTRTIADSISRNIRLGIEKTAAPNIDVDLDARARINVQLGLSVPKEVVGEPNANDESAPARTGQDSAAVGRAVASLAGVLANADAVVRLAAVQELGELDDPRAVEALSQALRNDSDPEVREMAAWALGEIESPAAVPALSEALRSDREARVRVKAAWALGEIESPRAVEALGAALRDDNIEVRRMAIWALGEIESPQAVASLVPLLRDQDRETREKTAWALGEIESADAVQGLSAAVRDSEASVREMAVWALGEIESQTAVEPLTAALEDSAIGVRRRAVWAIGEIDGLSSAPRALIAALTDGDREVRLHAARALGEIADPASVSALATAARGEDEQLRRAAAEALAEIRDQAALDVLIELLKSDDAEIRKAAAQALGRN
ncbi:MAG TPA: HEAT repeat domain-containing protein, partial [Gemmatimonadaceae bacterium]|nr:HEAT repeat domain-containing protein [Gemmatimonadaceae bacterium]